MQKESYGIWPNQGQVADLHGNPVPDVSMYTTGGVVTTYFQKTGLFSLVLATTDTVNHVDTLRQMNVACVGERANYPDPIVWEMKDRYANFYLPQCGPNGATNVHAYARVIYPEMYPHIDMQVYSGRAGQKIAFVVNQGGNPDDIVLSFNGQESIGLDVMGNLKLLLNGKWVVLKEAIAYQVGNDGQIINVPWTANYQVNEDQGTAKLHFAGYDRNKPLVFLIGPVMMGGTPPYNEEGICWSTYYGGDNYDYAKDAKGDVNGNMYVGGRTMSTFLSFPNHPGDQSLVEATAVATLTKFDVNDQLAWTNFIGGIANYPPPLPGEVQYPNRTFGELVAVTENDATGIYLGGSTTANNYLTHFKEGAYNNLTSDNMVSKGFIAKFDVEGHLDWSTYFGVDNVKIQGMDVLNNGNGDQLVISGRAANNLPEPPVPLPNALVYPYAGGSTDAFLALFDVNDQLSWRTYYGGTGTEEGVLVKATPSFFYLVGDTRSEDIPLHDQGGNPYQQAYQGGWDCFIAAFRGETALPWATYFGGTGDETLGPKGVAIAKNYDLLITGITAGLDMLVNGPGWYDDEVSTTDDNGFIARFRKDGAGTPLWISYLGSGPQHFPWSLDVARDGIISVGGYSNDPDFEPVERPGYYYQPNYQQDGFDGFITQFNDQQVRIWNTHFGGVTQGIVNPHIPENIMALNTINGELVATGYTEKKNVAVNSFFPLDDEGGAAWFNDLFNGTGFSNDFSDGFITRFCSEITIGIAEDAPAAKPGLQVYSPTPGSIILTGLSDGPHALRAYDAVGRTILAQEINSTAGRTKQVQVGEHSSALYIIRVDGTQTAKFIPVQ